MSNFSGSAINEGFIVSVNPLTYSAEVQESASTDTTAIECCFLMQHANSSETGSLVSIFPIGTKVLYLVNGVNSGIILGAIPTSSSSEFIDPDVIADDPLATMQSNEDFRGVLPTDVLPGQLSISNNKSRLHVKEHSLDVRAGTASMSLMELSGKSKLITTADSILHRNALLNLEVLDPGADKAASLELSAFLNNKTAQGSFHTIEDVQEEADFFISMNASNPLDIKYPLAGGKGSAGFSIDSKGVVTISGNSVQFKSNGEVVQSWGGAEESLNRTYSSDVSIKSGKNLSLVSTATSILKGSVLELDGSSSVSIASGNGKLSLIAGGTANLPAIPGRDETLVLASPSGGTRITAGSYLPGVGSATKPGIRIESDSGGDVHLTSTFGPGGAFTTGSIVLDTAVPASTALSGGTGAYGVVVNSPNTLLGGLPGVGDTPAGFPSPWLAPVPPVIDGYVKHFHFMTTYNATMVATLTAALAACFPPISASTAAPLFSGAMAGVLTSMTAPPIGRSLGLHCY